MHTLNYVDRLVLQCSIIMPYYSSVILNPVTIYFPLKMLVPLHVYCLLHAWHSFVMN